MENGEIILVPLLGLGNRMRAISAAASLAKDIGSRLHVVWIPYSGLSANFHELFETPRSFSITDVGWKPERRRKTKMGTLCRNSKRIYKCIRNARFDLRFDVLGTDTMNSSNQIDQLRFKKIFMSSFCKFYTMSPLSFSHFKPLPHLAREISNFSEKFDETTAGMHIRRTDNSKAIAKSPTGQFIKLVDQRIRDNPDCSFFLATDCPDIQKLFADRYQDRVFIRQKEFDRSTLQGMQSALIDLYLLSRCSEVIGSYWSSFSHTAADIGKIREITVRA